MSPEVYRQYMLFHILCSNDIPEWARFAAVDSGGELFVYAKEPYLKETNDYWSNAEACENYFYHHVADIIIPQDYTQTLVEL